MRRDFINWLAEFKDSIANYQYYINFEKIAKLQYQIEHFVNPLTS